MVHLHIADDGPGIPPANDSIFRNNQSERPTGTGFTKAFVLALLRRQHFGLRITIGGSDLVLAAGDNYWACSKRF